MSAIRAGSASESLGELTGDDDNDLAMPVRALYCTTAGNVNVIFTNDPATATGIVLPLEANVLYPFSIRRLLSTSTTATVVGMR